MRLKSIFLIFIISVNYCFSEDKFKDIFPIQFIPDSIINLESEYGIFNGYMIIEIAKNNPNNILNKEFYYCNCYFISSLDDLHNSNNHLYYNIAQLYYITAALSTSYEFSNDTSLKFMKFKKFYNEYLNNVELKQPFLYKMISTKIFLDTDFVLYKFDKYEDYGYYIIKCSFDYSILSYYCHPKNTKNCDINYLSLFFKKRQFILPTSSCNNFIPLDTIQAKEFGLEKATWTPNNLIYYNK